MSTPLLSVAVILRESDRNEKQVRENHRRMQELAGRLVGLQDKERRRIAAELHDSLGQTVALLQLQSTKCLHEMKDRGKLFEQLEGIATLASLANNEIRDITHNLRPYELDRLGLSQAVQALVERLADSTSIEFSSSVDRVDGLLSPTEETNVYRMIQEGLNNMIRHSNATRASVSILRMDDELHIAVEDNGAGFGVEGSAGKNGFGLSGLAERARSIGATVNVESVPEKGTRLTIVLGQLSAREAAVVCQRTASAVPIDR
jgi:signal transduction histidine kinase